MIYFVQFPAGSIKIGVTNNLDHRLAGLASHYGHEPVLLHAMEGDIETEREIHGRFSHLRFGKTEQFRPGPDLMEFIGRPPLVGQDPDAIGATDLSLSGRKKQVITVHLRPETLEQIEAALLARPEWSGVSAALEWAWRVATEKGGES